MKLLFRACLLVTFLFSFVLCRAAGREEPLQLDPSDRILVLAPHPDDEVLGTAGVIQRALELKIPVHVAFLTYGDNNAWAFAVYRKHPIFSSVAMQQMGEVRRREALAASKILGVPESNLTFLGYPDHGTMRIWTDYWGSKTAFRSQRTKVRVVPYANAYRPGAPYKGEEVVKDIKSLLRELKPTKIFVTHPADENPDHRAFYLFMRVALWDLKKEMNPTVFPFLIHYRFRHWPVPQGLHPNRSLVLPDIFSRNAMMHTFELSPVEVQKKFLALQQHKTQFNYSSHYLSSFVRANEVFNDFPLIDLRVTSPATIEEDELIAMNQLPDEFTAEEKEGFPEPEKRKAAFEDGRLVLTVNYKNPLKEKGKLLVYLFGYKTGTDFTEMPKIKIEISRIAHAVRNGPHLLPDNSIQLIRQKNKSIIKIPMNLLGSPERILTGIQSSLEDFPLDCMAWRVLVP